MSAEREQSDKAKYLNKRKILSSEDDLDLASFSEETCLDHKKSKQNDSNYSFTRSRRMKNSQPQNQNQKNPKNQGTIQREDGINLELDVNTLNSLDGTNYEDQISTQHFIDFLNVKR